MTQSELVQLELELTETQAGQLAQFLKRCGFSDFLDKTVNENEEDAYLMQAAVLKVREALAEAGFEPR